VTKVEAAIRELEKRQQELRAASLRAVEAAVRLRDAREEERKQRRTG
jgi:hypothetical protein